MHPVQANEAIQWAERRHQEQLGQAELNQLARTLRQPKQWTITATGLVAHPIWLAVVLLTVFLAVATV